MDDKFLLFFTLLLEIKYCLTWSHKECFGNGVCEMNEDVPRAFDFKFKLNLRLYVSIRLR